jgi:hypothetical protein
MLRWATTVGEPAIGRADGVCVAKPGAKMILGTARACEGKKARTTTVAIITEGW